MDLKALDAFTLERVDKGQLYELYNHYLPYPVLSLQQDKKKQLCLHQCLFRLGINLKLILH